MLNSRQKYKYHVRPTRRTFFLLYTVYMAETIIFTDGSARGNTGPGGWGAIIVANETVLEIGGSEEHTTNNRMELSAAISALEKVQKEKDIIIVYTDSAYVLSGSTRWVFGWE